MLVNNSENLHCIQNNNSIIESDEWSIETVKYMDINKKVYNIHMTIIAVWEGLRKKL